MAKGEGVNLNIHEGGAIELLAIIHNPFNARSYKEAALQALRRIEKIEGRTYYPTYNGVSRNPSEMARAEEEMKD